MTIIQSKTTVSKPINEVYAFLADFNNHQQLMPDQVTNWSSTKEEAHFTIQNMATLGLKISSLNLDKEIIMVPSEKAPFDIVLKWTLSAKSEELTEINYVISADLNMMLKMIALTPLQKLADHQTSQLKAILG